MQKKYDFFQIQEKIKKWWKEKKVFSYSPKDQKENYIVDTPPPTVSGKLHIGHIFSYTHQDFVVRYKRMQGFTIIYPFGFDDNGLPTERYIEKKRGISSHQYLRKEFRELCLEEISHAHQSFISLWQTIGLSCDWDLLYSTISQEVSKLSQKMFLDLYKKGFIYKKNEPSLYCTTSRTSISQAELEEVEKNSKMITIPFKNNATDEDILIATTRPELLGACVAILVNPRDQKNKHLIGQTAKVPLYNHIAPIIADEDVIPEKGTGVVMSATFGDALDVKWFKKHSFAYKKIIDFNGKITSLGGFLEGLKIGEAREAVSKKLEEEGLLIKSEDITHRVSVYERSKKEIEYVMLSQWFVKILDYKKQFLEVANNITWLPDYMKSRYIDWVKNLSWDWCISRQRNFGIPFPVWYKKNGDIITAKIDALPVDPLIEIPEGYTKEDLEGDRDVMDTWNTSSITPYIIKDLILKKHGVEISLPLSLRPQSHDIIRTWAFDTIVKSFFTENKIPWEAIMISGHVIAPNNQKISKSKGNSPYELDNLLKTYPADVIRYWTASAKLGVDTVFSETRCKDGNRLIIKLINAGKCISNFAFFAQINSLQDEKLFEQYPRVVDIGEIPSNFLFNPTYLFDTEFLKKNSVGTYFLYLFEKTKIEYHQFFSNLDYSGALQSIEKFFWNFCDNYLEVIKIYQYEKDAFEKEDIAKVQKITGYLFLQILSYFAPFIPFITEELYHIYYSNINSIHLSKHCKKEYFSENSFEKLKVYTVFFEIISEVRKIKSEKNISLKSEITKATIYFKDKELINLIKNENTLIFILKSMFLIKELSFNIYNKKNEAEPFTVSIKIEI